MSRRLAICLRRFAALIVVAGVATFGTWLLDAALCLARGCIEDDAGRLAHAIIPDAIVVAAYVVLTWVAVFLPTVGIFWKFETLFAAAIPAAVVASALSYLLFDSDHDELGSAVGLSVLLTVPWTIANLAGLVLWLSPDDSTAGGREASGG